MFTCSFKTSNKNIEQLILQIQSIKFSTSFVNSGAKHVDEVSCFDPAFDIAGVFVLSLLLYHKPYKCTTQPNFLSHQQSFTVIYALIKIYLNQL